MPLLSSGKPVPRSVRCLPFFTHCLCSWFFSHFSCALFLLLFAQPILEYLHAQVTIEELLPIPDELPGSGTQKESEDGVAEGHEDPEALQQRLRSEKLASRRLGPCYHRQ